MKKRINYVVAIVVLISITFAASAQKKIISSSKLPKAITSYLSNNFPKNPILQVSLKERSSSKRFKIILKSNIKVEFNSKYGVTKIEANSQLPYSVIPREVLKYVKANYPNAAITEWELEHQGQQVELDNGLELNFDMTGKFLRIDD